MNENEPSPTSPAESAAPAGAAKQSARPAAPASPRGGKWLRYRRLPTWRTWLAVLALTAGLVVWLGPKFHGWLAVTDPVPGARYFVVEGWCPDYVMTVVQADAEASGPLRVFTTGIPIDTGTFLAEHKNFAHLAAATLTKCGLDPALIAPVPAAASTRNRTAAMAAALKAALDSMNIPEADRTINLYTLGTHARRSRQIFQRILGSSWKVGVISVADLSYESGAWYKHSAGAKRVIEELVSLGVVACGGE
jgi:hypothetical protein